MYIGAIVSLVREGGHLLRLRADWPPAGVEVGGTSCLPSVPLFRGTVPCPVVFCSRWPSPPDSLALTDPPQWSEGLRSMLWAGITQSTFKPMLCDLRLIASPLIWEVAKASQNVENIKVLGMARLWEAGLPSQHLTLEVVAIF